MLNNGNISVLLGSLKVLKENLERTRGRIDPKVFSSSEREIEAMKRFLEELASPRII